MNSRNFSSKNTYKLTKRIVLTLAAIAFMYSLLMFNASRDYISGVEWIRTYNRICEPLQSSAAKGDCLLIVRDMFETRFNRAWQALFIAITLPSVFFIITKTFDYLFPKKREREEQ